MIKKRFAEYRALENEKGLVEKREDLIIEMDKILADAKAETRTLKDEENKRFEEIRTEITNIDTTLKAIEERAAIEIKVPAKGGKEEEEKIEVEERAFANYIRNKVDETRATNLTFSDNGAVIPSSIANKIIKKVYDISPIYQLATRYNVGGTLSIPYYDESTQSIQMTYSNEFTELTSTSGKFKSIDLKGYLAGALSLVSLSLVNNSNFDIVSFVIQAMSESISKWIEKELIKGTASKIDGLAAGVTQSVTTAVATSITVDELIDVQETVPDVYQASSIWIMNKATRTALRKLKDADGQYLLNKDVSAKWGYTLLGKDVYVSDNVDAIAATKTAIYYGDMSGLAVKLSEDVSIQVLRESYATQHALGVVAWIELDAKVENAQKIAKLVMKA